MNDPNPTPVDLPETFKYYSPSNIGHEIDQAVIKGFLYKVGTLVTFWHFGEIVMGEVAAIREGGVLEVNCGINNRSVRFVISFYEAFATDFQLLLELYDRRLKREMLILIT